MNDLALRVLLGVAVGDALGVPYEFTSRSEMKLKPAMDMIGYGTHNQPAGTWSDDSALTFCLAEAIIQGYSLPNVATKFVQWRDAAYWSARNEVFDIGMTTSRSISQIQNLDEEQLKLLKYEANEEDNGNGSLMRILPLLFIWDDKSLKEQFELVWDNSSLTHKHIRAGMACMIYLKFAEFLVRGDRKADALYHMQNDIQMLWNEINFSKQESDKFHLIMNTDISKASEKVIKSSGYVLDSLEASLWCFMTTDTFTDSILKAVNLGGDTDTIAAITGGLSGIYYSLSDIPEYWLALIARLEDILDLADRLTQKSN